ncbi:M57 family metalloprotease [Autumnicola edwardsiae]|uniref:M57 family metalloprotease n=1 Tax=Autumnicola edwardsiae TaxID=3075594 RepID=A0ABU3CZD1_9FLAO|nr:M57 family metalloprotease [Zunongwangia sp. F297]MDT0651728.1 M57 family metalloprotease [Zunongwangia sp. F297]
MKITRLLLLAAITVAVSCQKEEAVVPSESSSIQDSKVSKETIAKIESLNLNAEGVEKVEMQLPDGSKKVSYLIEGDIAIDAEQLDNMKAGDITDKQYRTYSLVYSPRVIQIVGWTGMGFGQNLTEKQQEALENAVENYNSLDLGLTFELSFSNDQSLADIVIFQVPDGSVGGSAGFPAGGNPYPFVQIYSGMENYSLEVNTHVMTHEIGHTLGLRHTDWFTRESCGRPSFGELANPTGSVHIPGTPFRLDPNSIMLSCFSASEDGKFGEFDVVALEYIY